VSPEKGGALRNQSTGGRRLGVAAVLCGALFLVPLLLLHNGTAQASRTEAVAHRGHDVPKVVVHPPSHLDKVDLPSHLVAFSSPVSTTSTTAPPVTTSTTAPAPTTTVPAPVTTTTQPPPPPPPPTTTTTTTTSPPPPPAPTHSEVGDATWYAEAPTGYCASPTLPFGTVLTVVDNATGASTRCTVDDREGAGYPRVVDLSPEGFSQIAAVNQGVVEVTISW
jgi:hypothetical protein